MGMLDTTLTQINKILGKELTYQELEDILFQFGLDIKGKDGDALKIEITPDRYDLLSVQGLCRALRAYFEIKPGMPKYKIEKYPSFVKIENPLDKWPYAVAFVVKDLKLDDEKIKEIIQLQEKYGELLLKKRKKGGIGIYPLDKIKFPVTFTSRKLDEIEFEPLGFEYKMTGRQILSRHPTGRKYAHILNEEEKYPVFVDSSGTIMSMPPIINSQTVGKIDENTRNVFFEATGPELVRLKQVANLFAAFFADIGGKVYSLDVKYKDKTLTFSEMKPIKKEVSIANINQVLGTNLLAGEVKKLLTRMMYDIVESNDEKLIVTAPAFRTDLWQEIDIIDDIGRAYGYDNLTPTFPNVSTTGGTLPKTDFEEKLAEVFVGLGFQEVVTFILTSRQDQYKRMNIEEEQHVPISNAAESSINTLRTWILPELLKVLERNQRYPYPQRLFEIGFVVIPDENVKDVFSRNIRKLSCVIADDSADFNQAKQNLDAMMRLLGLNYEIIPSNHHSFDDKRQGKIVIEGREIGIIGEINKNVLKNWNLRVAVVGFEVDVDLLFDIVMSKH